MHTSSSGSVAFLSNTPARTEKPHAIPLQAAQALVAFFRRTTVRQYEPQKRSSCAHIYQEEGTRADWDWRVPKRVVIEGDAEGAWFVHPGGEKVRGQLIAGFHCVEHGL